MNILHREWKCDTTRQTDHSTRARVSEEITEEEKKRFNVDIEEEIFSIV